MPSIRILASCFLANLCFYAVSISAADGPQPGITSWGAWDGNTIYDRPAKKPGNATYDYATYFEFHTAEELPYDKIGEKGYNPNGKVAQFVNDLRDGKMKEVWTYLSEIGFQAAGFNALAKCIATHQPESPLIGQGVFWEVNLARSPHGRGKLGVEVRFRIAIEPLVAGPGYSGVAPQPAALKAALENPNPTIYRPAISLIVELLDDPVTSKTIEKIKPALVAALKTYRTP